MDRDDLFHGHIGGIDTLAQSLLVAEALIDDGALDDAATVSGTPAGTVGSGA